MLTPRLLLALPPSLRARRELQPLIYSTLEKFDRLALLEPEARARGRQARLATLARNVRLLEHAARILDAAGERGLRILPLKGALFAAALYPDAGARPMVDVDLIVHPDDLDAAVALMPGLGFRRAYPDSARFTPKHAHDVSFVDAHNLSVELHYRLFHELAADGDVAPLFARATTIELFGRARAVPAWDDHLFAVAVHAAAHAFGDSPLWIFDLAFLLARGARVEAAAREAERRRAGAAFRAALATAHAVLPSLIPPPARAAGDFVRERLLTLVLGRDRLAAPPRRVPSLLARALLTDDPRDAAREIFRKAGLRAVEARERWRRA